MTEILLGGVILAALVFYVLLGGADYGGGVWDLLASGPRAREQRTLIENAIGPVWEANHVWLILVVVVLFTAFPPAFARVTTHLFTPLTLLLFGIVLRGTAFTFRAYDRRADNVQRTWGAVFSGASVVAPVVLGACVGALASGRPSEWLAPFPITVGLFALCLFSFLAAVYLTVEAEDDPLREDFRRRALTSGALVGALALAAFLLSADGASVVRRGLTERLWSLPFHLATGVAAVGAFAMLWARRFRLARLCAALQAALIVVGWGASQYPYLVVPELTLWDAAAPRITQVLLLWALGVGSLLLFPSLYVLFRVFKGERPFAVLERPRGARR